MAREIPIPLTTMIKRQWSLALLCLCGCVVAAALVTLCLPRRYESEMKFLVNNERANLVVSPGEEQSNTTPAEVSETEVNSEIELIRSKDILDQVVRDQKLYTSFVSGSSREPTPKAIEEASQKLAKKLSVSSLRKTNIIAVTYRGSTPEAAAAVLDDIRGRYEASHLQAHSASGTDTFFRDQVAHYGYAMARARAELAEFRARTHVFSMPDQQAALVRQLEETSAQLIEVRARIHVEQSKNTEASRQLSHTPARIVTQVKDTADTLPLQQLEPMLAQLENRRIELATKFRPTDRLVLELDNQIASTRQAIARIREERIAEQTSDLNSVHQAILSDVAKSQIDLRGLQTQRGELEQRQHEYEQQLAELDRTNISLQNLDLAEKQAKDSYDLYTRRLNEAQLAKALDRNKISNVVLIETPVASPIPVSPKLSLNLLAGVVVGLLLGVSLAVVREVRRIEPTWPWDLVEESMNQVPDPALHVLSGK